MVRTGFSDAAGEIGICISDTANSTCIHDPFDRNFEFSNSFLFFQISNFKFRFLKFAPVQLTVIKMMTVLIVCREPADFEPKGLGVLQKEPYIPPYASDLASLASSELLDALG